MRGRHAIDTRHDLDALLHHGEVSGMGAEIADVVAPHREELALGVERELGLDHEVAALIVAQQRLVAVGGPLDRAAELACGPGHQRLLGEDCPARPEVAAHVTDDEPHVVLGDVEHDREVLAQAQGRAAAGMDRIFATCRIVGADRGARFHGRGGDPRHPGPDAGDVGRARECRRRRRFVADAGIDADIGAVVLVQERRTWHGRGGRVGDAR
jgi:hypothetical protein